ncbi:hypothetical protein [Acinetobacter pittii]|uniref:hypothetical protein n=1 Tax=Acinetobacter pittii TaxID=48296 RepID=UPI0027403A9F|nr:hypothetical protein [Acinetobacter pittii]MDP7845283.1 hypothetical protein [Acinetobacter pittii]
MRSLHQVAASEIAVVPYYLNGYQQNGLQYGVNEYERAEPLGAQCANCHTILWITGRSDPILNETKPKNIPDSGPIYREYIQDNLKRFLRSLPACPNCHQQTYDLFVHTTTLTRFEDGSSYPEYPEEYYGVDEERSAKVKDKAVWWYGDEAEAKRLNLNFL